MYLVLLIGGAEEVSGHDPFAKYWDITWDVNAKKTQANKISLNNKR